MVGWAQSGINVCAGCGPEIWLEARNDRLVFDVVSNNGLRRYVGLGAGTGGYAGGSGPVTMDLTLSDLTWQFDVTGSGSDVHLAGAFVAGWAPSDVMAAAGGLLSTFASVRSDCPPCGDGGTFSHAEVDVPDAIPEPSTLLLLGTALVALAGLRRGRGGAFGSATTASAATYVFHDINEIAPV